MADYTNAERLAGCLAQWARPAISQIAASKLANIPMLQSIQKTIIGSGLVGASYNITSDIMPFLQPVVNSLMLPMMTNALGNIPDAAIPSLAHGIVDTALKNGTLSILDGVIEFDANDLQELKDLLNKNLPINNNIEQYQVQ